MESTTKTSSQLIEEYEASNYGPEDACIQVLILTADYNVPPYDGEIMHMPVRIHKKTRDILVSHKPTWSVENWGYHLGESYDVTSQEMFDTFKMIQGGEEPGRRNITKILSSVVKAEE